MAPPPPPCDPNGKNRNVFSIIAAVALGLIVAGAVVVIGSKVATKIYRYVYPPMERTDYK